MFNLKNKIMEQEYIVGVNISELPDPFLRIRNDNKVRNYKEIPEELVKMYSGVERVFANFKDI